jgi:ATP-dependent protease ClpP protease subunit
MPDINVELPRDVTRIWDLQVPIVENKDERTISVYLHDTIDEPCVYNELCHTLDIDKASSTIKLYLNTQGGVMDTAFMVADAIERSKSQVIAYVSGTVASAGTLLTMVCDDIIIAPFTSFMIHNYSGGGGGFSKGHELKARQAFVDKQLNDAFKSFYLGFLTDEEMARVIEGTDFWMGTEEIQKRWNKHITQQNMPLLHEEQEL